MEKTFGRCISTPCSQPPQRCPPRECSGSNWIQFPVLQGSSSLVSAPALKPPSGKVPAVSTRLDLLMRTLRHDLSTPKYPRLACSRSPCFNVHLRADSPSFLSTSLISFLPLCILNQCSIAVSRHSPLSFFLLSQPFLSPPWLVRLSRIPCAPSSSHIAGSPSCPLPF